MGRHGLTDEEWARIEPLLPRLRGRRGRPWNDHRRIIDGILWTLMTGAPWRDLPRQFGPYTTVHGRFSRWARDGTWARLQASLLGRLHEQGRLDRELWFIDGTCVRATRAAAGAGKKGGPTSRPTTRWVDHGVASEPRSTSYVTARECRSPSQSVLASAMRASGSRGPWTRLLFPSQEGMSFGAPGGLAATKVTAIPRFAAGCIGTTSAQ